MKKSVVVPLSRSADNEQIILSELRRQTAAYILVDEAAGTWFLRSKFAEWMNSEKEQKTA